MQKGSHEMGKRVERLGNDDVGDGHGFEAAVLGIGVSICVRVWEGLVLKL